MNNICRICGQHFFRNYWQPFCNECGPKPSYIYAHWSPNSTSEYPYYIGLSHSNPSRCLEPHQLWDGTWARCEQQRRKDGGRVLFAILHQGLERDIAEWLEYLYIKYYQEAHGACQCNIMTDPPHDRKPAKYTYEITPGLYDMYLRKYEHSKKS